LDTEPRFPPLSQTSDHLTQPHNTIPQTGWHRSQLLLSSCTAAVSAKQSHTPSQCPPSRADRSSPDPQNSPMVLRTQTEVMQRLPIITLKNGRPTRSCSEADTSSTPAGEEARITSMQSSEVLHPAKELKERTFIKGFQSSEHSHGTFCGRCGTHLSFYYSGEDDDMVAEDKWGPHFDIPGRTLRTRVWRLAG